MMEKRSLSWEAEDDDAGAGVPPRSPLRQTWERLRRDRMALGGALLVVLLLVVGLLGPLLAPHNPITQYDAGLDDNGSPLLFSPKFLLGTDTLGRDILSRIIYGARISLTVGVLANGLAMLIGVAVGATAGYAGGWVDTVLMRLTDVVLAFPGLLLAMALITLFTPSLLTIVVVIAATVWTSMARIVRGQVLSIKQQEFVEAARALGAPTARIVLHHVLPQLMSVVIVYLTLNIAATVLLEAGLSYLGLGIQVPTPDWGAMIADGQSYYASAPWLMLYPGFALLLTVLGFNLLGDGLRDALDPRTERR